MRINITMSKMSKKQQEYQEFFKKKLKEFGVESPADFKDDKEEKRFWNTIELEWTDDDDSEE